MFNCAHCGYQSTSGEKPTVVPTVLRPVLYEYTQEGRSYMGAEWAQSATLCSTCALNFEPTYLISVKTVEVQYGTRYRIPDQAQYL